MQNAYVLIISAAVVLGLLAGYLGHQSDKSQVAYEEDLHNNDFKE